MPFLPPGEMWIEKIRNPITRERTKRRLLRAYDVDGATCYGAREVYERLSELGYTLTFNQVNHLVNHCYLSRSLHERYPELDPDNPDGKVKLISKGQFYDRWKRREGTTRFVLVYYFENDEHTRFYGVSSRRLDYIYKNFTNALQYLPVDDKDLDHYTMEAHAVVDLNGARLGKAYDVMDRAIFDYLVDNPDYEAYNIDLICHV